MQCACGSGDANALGGAYHFLESGLPNVYLVGHPHFECASCGEVTVEIPNVSQLLAKIAEQLVLKKGKLTGRELRFLRKAAGMTQADIASELSVDRTTVARWETDAVTSDPRTDLTIRMFWIRAEASRYDSPDPSKSQNRRWELLEHYDRVSHAISTFRKVDGEDSRIEIDVKDLAA